MNTEEWLKQNTFRCPIGRVSLKQCESLRKRPVFGEKISLSTPNDYNLYMPRVCEKCTEWKKFADSYRNESIKKKENRKEKNQMKETVICKECGGKFEPYKNGKNIITSYCPECLRIKKQKGILKRKVEKNAEKLLFCIRLTGFPNLYDQLIKSANKNIRTPEHQAIAYLVESLEADGFKIEREY